jgi:hypothetical protein
VVLRAGEHFVAVFDVDTAVEELRQVAALRALQDRLQVVHQLDPIFMKQFRPNFKDKTLIALAAWST